MRISVTDLESWRYWLESEDATMDDLLRRLAHVEPPTRKMQAGRAFAKFIEGAQLGEMVDSAIVDGWTFHFDCYAKMVKPVVHEMKVESTVLTPHGPVTLVGKVDMLSGIVVRDQKLIEQFEVEGKYTDSLQWRAYLWMLKCQRFDYDIFVGKVEDDTQEVVIRDYHGVSFYTYPELERDVTTAVNMVASILTMHGGAIEEMRSGARS